MKLKWVYLYDFHQIWIMMASWRLLRICAQIPGSWSAALLKDTHHQIFFVWIDDLFVCWYKIFLLKNMYTQTHWSRVILVLISSL